MVGAVVAAAFAALIRPKPNSSSRPADPEFNRLAEKIVESFNPGSLKRLKR